LEHYLDNFNPTEGAWLSLSPVESRWVSYPPKPKRWKNTGFPMFFHEAKKID